MSKTKTIFEKYSHIPKPDEMRKMEEQFFDECHKSKDARIPDFLARKLRPDNGILAKIGEMAVEWSELERRVDETIWHVLETPADRGACLTAQFVGPGPRCRALMSLCRVANISNDIIEDIAQFKKEAGQIGSKRNRILHDYWFELVDIRTRESTIIRHEIEPESPHSQKQKNVTIDDIDKWINEAAHLKNIFVQAVFQRVLIELLQRRHKV